MIKNVFLEEINQAIEKITNDFQPGDIVKEQEKKYLGVEKIFAGKIIYDSNEQKQIINELLNTFYTLSMKCAREEYDPYIFQFFKQLINIYSLFFKKVCFHSEKEYRIIVILPRQIYNFPGNLMHMEFPVTNGCFAPKLEITIDWKKIITKIKIGPKNNMDFAKQGLNQFLINNGMIDKEITQSNIPIRF